MIAKETIPPKVCRGAKGPARSGYRSVKGLTSKQLTEEAQRRTGCEMGSLNRVSIREHWDLE